MIDHLVPLAEGWRLLRTAVVRGAGFPAALVLELACEPATAACDRLIQGSGDRAAAEQAFESGREVTAAALVRFAGRRDFIEALTWQNRGVIDSAIRPFLARPGAQNSGARRKQQLIASYLQRYCSKNDTVGFFGPIGWATIDPDARTSLEPGPNLVSVREVSLEHWAVDAMARSLAEDLKPRLAPRRMPSVRVEGEQLIYADGRRAALPAEVVALVAACDGTRSATELAGQLGLDLEDVLDLLEQLAAKGIVIWAIEIPVGVTHPDRHLHAALDELGASDALARLKPVEAAREQVAAAAGDPPRLDQAIGELERAFTEVTGDPATRRGGETYGGRTVFYEDCVRDVTCVLGRAVLDRISRPLALVLQSARWFTHQIAERYEAHARQTYRAMAGDASAIPFQQFWQHMEPDGLAHLSSVVEEVGARLTRTWADLLGPFDPDRPVVCRAEVLGPRVRERFAAPKPGWPHARLHSPDLLIGAASAAAMERGELTAVLGELHVTLNSMLAMALSPHLPPDPGWEELAAEPPALFPVPAKSLATRAMHLAAPHQIHLEIGSARSPFPRERVVEIADLVVEESEGSLWARTLDRRRRFPLLAALEGSLSVAAHSRFRILPSRQPHTPRVTIDDLVIARESWNLAAAEIEFAAQATPFDRFLGARRWAQRLGLPRFLFAKLSSETKPFFVDLHSPVLVEILAHRARAADWLSLSEMLPTFDELWLADREGNRYTSELRMVAVDPVAA